MQVLKAAINAAEVFYPKLLFIRIFGTKTILTDFDGSKHLCHIFNGKAYYFKKLPYSQREIF